jgi:hypothetical protein
MNAFIVFLSASASADADCLISGVVGSFQGTTAMGTT